MHMGQAVVEPEYLEWSVEAQLEIDWVTSPLAGFAIAPLSLKNVCFACEVCHHLHNIEFSHTK